MVCAWPALELVNMPWVVGADKFDRVALLGQASSIPTTFDKPEGAMTPLGSSV